MNDFSDFPLPTSAAPAPPTDALVGTVIADRYVVRDVLGAGASAHVYLAFDRVLDRPVALKLLGTSASSQVDIARFEREIRLTARLVHPAIVPLFDSGHHDDRLFYVMPCVDGITVRQWLDTNGPMPTQQALRFASDIAEALSYAHAMGVVHRDIKPENIFCANGRALVADFGIACALDRRTTGEKAHTLTEAGVAIGTVAYMSPEQAMGERELDGRSDLYALGCVLVELLCGRPPFRGSTAMHVLAQHLSAAPPLATLLPESSTSVTRLLSVLLAKEPSDRPASAAVLIETLQELTQLKDVPAAPPPPPARAPDSESPAERAMHEARTLFNAGMQGGVGTGDVLALARVHAERAVSLEPHNARAMSVLADVIHVLGFRGFIDEADAFAESQRIRLAAMAIDDTIGELHISLGVVRLFWQDDFFGAERFLERGARLAPYDGVALRHYATWLKMAGRFDEALEWMQTATRATPDAPHIQVGLADVLMSMGRHVEAIAPLQRALRLVPRYSQATERLEMACHRAGRTDDAYAARRTMLGTQGLLARLDQLSTTFERDGWEAARTQDLRAELGELLTVAEREDPFVDRHTSRTYADRIIITCGELGEWKQAMDWIERGYYLRPGRLIRVLTDLPFDRRGLASDRRYARLLRTAGLEFLL